MNPLFIFRVYFAHRFFYHSSMLKMFLIFCLLSTKFCFAWDNPLAKFSQVDIQLGTWLERYSQLQSTRNGEKNGFELTPFVSAGLLYNMSPKWKFRPEALYVIRQSSDQIDKDIFCFQLDFTYKFTQKWSFILGSSLLVQSISSNGGEEKINNGNTTDSFYLPNERRTSYIQTLDLGFEWREKNYGAKFQSYIYRLDENFPQYSLALGLLYSWEKK